MEQECFPVNVITLDSFALEYAKRGKLLEFNFSSSHHLGNVAPPPDVSSIVEHVRGLICSGSILAAKEILMKNAPAVLSEPRLSYWMQKQEFIELVRMHRLNEALFQARSNLGPNSLHAYPEAYAEFKRIMLTLLTTSENEPSPWSEELSQEKRDSLAAQVATAMKTASTQEDDALPLILVYLISLHNRLHSQHGWQSSVVHLTSELIINPPDPPPLPKDAYGLPEEPAMDEAMVQCLTQSIGISRQEAVESLKFAAGDLTQAFKNELRRFRINQPFLDLLVHEYCVFRGLVDSPLPWPDSFKLTADEPETEQAKHSEGASQHHASLTSPGNDGNDFVLVSKGGLQGLSRRESKRPHFLISDSSHAECDQEICIRRRLNDIAGERSMLSHFVEESGFEKTKVITADRTGLEEGNEVEEDIRCRQRWRGRRASSEPRGSSNECSIGNTNLSANAKIQKKYANLLQIQSLINNGQIDKVFKLELLDADFQREHLRLMFTMRQAQFAELVENRNFESALTVAQKFLGPMAALNLDFLPLLKASLLTLLFPDESTCAPSKKNLAVSIQLALARKIGLVEPRLLQLLGVLLKSHSLWFEIQLCKDNFANLLKIPALTLGTSNEHAQSHGESGKSTSCENSTSPKVIRTEDNTEAQGINEAGVLQLMEFMAVSRADAVHILAHHNGDVDLVFSSLLS